LPDEIGADESGAAGHQDAGSRHVAVVWHVRSKAVILGIIPQPVEPESRHGVTRILLIKTSSMGDVVHNLPVVDDIRGTFPDARIEWVVEEGFAAIPRLHPGVSAVIPVGLRSWRRRLLDRGVRREIAACRARLRESPYDAVIDTQGLLKSAVVARMAAGVRHGLDWRSSREPLRLFYDHTHTVPWSLHAVERNRLLAAKALGYAVRGEPQYGIATTLSAATSDGVDRSRPLAMLLHATSAAGKEWPESSWIGLGRALAGRNVSCVLPFGSDVERDRSQRLAASIPAAQVPPRLGLDALASLMSACRVIVGVDTGLSHLAVALGRPTIGLYCATDPAATGLYGSASAVNLGGIGRAPSVEEALAATTRLLAT
jgi:heptosyltransferase-1